MVRNKAVDVISMFSADGEIRPLRLRMEDEEHQLLRIDIDEIISMKPIEYVGIEALNVAGMSNYSKNRLHTNGNTAVYPTFVNEGNRVTLNGDVEIAKITLKAKKNIKFNIKAIDGIIVDKHLNSIKF